MGKFLGLAKPWDLDTILPEQHKKKPVTILDCKSFDYLTDYYNKQNKGLIAFINNGPKHSEEPIFPPFGGNRSVCKDISSNAPLYAIDLLNSEAGQLGSKSDVVAAAKKEAAAKEAAEKSSSNRRNKR